MKNKTSKSGFTLIELLVVIAIIGLLASIMAINLSTFLSRARDTTRKANLAQLAKALEIYYDDNGSYPDTLPWNTAGHCAWWAEEPVYSCGRSLSGPLGYIPNLAPKYVAQLPHDSLTGQDRTSFNPSCDRYSTYYFYISNKVDYKLQAFCLNETIVTPEDPFYDPSWPGVALTVSSPGAKNW